MKGLEKFLLLALLACATTALAWGSASDLYISQSGTGAKTGSSCGDALAASFFNNSSNWGAGTAQIGPGTTVHLCGIFTGSAGSTALAFQGSGASGNPVTVLFEAGAQLTNPAYWGSNTNGAITAQGVSWIAIDGGSDGLIQNRGNGSGLGNQEISKGVFLNVCKNCLVQNLTVADIYQHTSTADQSGNAQSTAGIDVNSSNNVTITGNTVRDASSGIQYNWANGDSGITISNNSISNCNWGIGAGSRNDGATTSNFKITGNDISDAVNWDDSNDTFHHNGIHVYTTGPSSNAVGLVVSNNFVHGDFGENETGHIFLDIAGGLFTSPLIFNNVLSNSNPSHSPGNGFLAIGGTNAGIYNNTIAGGTNLRGIGIKFGPGSVAVENNIVTDVGTGMYLNSGATMTVGDYNVWFNLSGNAMKKEPEFYSSLAAWRGIRNLECEVDESIVLFGGKHHGQNH